MQRKIETEIKLAKTVHPFDSISILLKVHPFDAVLSMAEDDSAIDRTASHFLNAIEAVQKIRKLIQTGEYDADIVKYIPGTLDLFYQEMLEDIDTKEQLTHILYKDKENLEF